MKKIGKRLLSMFLAAVMVFTTVPFAALTSLAKTAEPDSYAFLTKNDNFAGFTNYGNVTWDSTEQAAHFDGNSSLRMTGLDAFKNISTGEDFAISFDFKKESGMSTWGWVFTLSDSSQANRIGYSAGIRDDYLNSCGIAAVGNKYNWYYSNDFNDNNHSYNGSAWNPVRNRWYNLTLYMNVNGELSFFVDGALQGTFRADYNNASSNGEMDANLITGAISNWTQLDIGSSCTQAENFKGYIKNLQFESFSSEDAPVDLKTAMDAYEAKMADGKVYKNLSAAYTQYQKASARYDAYVYGDTVAGDAIDAAQQLTLATAAMQPWYAKTSANDYNRVYKNDSADLPAANHNLLWVQTNYDAGSNSRGNVSNGSSPPLAKYVYYPEATMFYADANSKPTVAVMLYMTTTNANGNKNRYVITAFNNTPNTTLVNTKWGGNVGDNYDANWGINQAASGTKLNATNSNTTNYSTSDVFQVRKKGTFSSSSTDARFANILQYTGTMNDSTAYVSIKPSFTVYGNSEVAWSTTDGLNGTVTGGTDIHVINYARLVNKINATKGNVAGITIANYKEGGAAAYFTAFDALTSFNIDNYFTSANNWNTCQSDMTTAINGVNNAATPTADSKYTELKRVFDRNTPPASYPTAQFTVVTASQATGIDPDLKATFDGYYSTAYSAFQALASNLYGSSQATLASNLETAYDALKKDNIIAPSLSVANGTYIGPNDTITIIDNDERVGDLKYTLAYDGGAAGASTTYTAAFAPFGGATNKNTVTVSATKALSATRISEPATATYNLLKQPTITPAISQNGILLKTETVDIVSASGLASPVLEYSYDGTNWSTYTGAITPFTDNNSAAVLTIYAREKNGTYTSAVTTLNVSLKGTFNAYLVSPDEKGADRYNENSSIEINDSTYPGGVKYQISFDGAAYTAAADYTAAIPTNTSDFNNATIVKIKAYSASNPANVAYSTFVNANSTYDALAYRESFDSSTVSGSTLNVDNEKEPKTISGNGGNISIESGAGSVVSGGSYNGRSPDWRNKVLKMASGSQNGLTLSSNPLASASQKIAATAQGVTISFWRYVPSNTAQLTDEALRIANADNSNYFAIYASADTVRRNGTSGELRLIPDAQDPTQHAAGNYRNVWIHVAVTIDPEKGVTVYTNGEPHPTTVNHTGTYADNDAAAAADILDFITTDTNRIRLAYSGSGTTKDIYLDDIRMYSDVLTQVDINNTYTDKYADVKNTMSTSHDPTNVTVYTLSNGKKVGVEYFRGAAPSGYVDIDYYSFGTGMTIYHSKDNVNWTIVGDSQGRCGYQNEDLFGAEYTEALAAPLNYAKNDTLHEGAGYLVWAPHVMYNITLDKWVYYGSTSSWGSQISTIFMCTSNDPITGYKYKEMVYKSSTHPNAIDSCIYYNADYTKLYMLYGSWGGTECIYVKEMNLDGTAKDSTKGTRLANGVNNSLEGGYEGSSGEGAYVVYDNGYYYLYVSYGQNTGSYTERVFRSESPDSGFYCIQEDSSGNNVTATDTTTHATHGNQLLAPFDINLYDHTYVSTGHNSAYKVKSAGPDAKMGTEDDEFVTLNSVHARPYASESHNMKGLQDGALATRQRDVTGNINLLNLIGYTIDGWPVLFPDQYDGTDSLKRQITAYDLEGIYTADDMRLQVNSEFGLEYTFTMLAKSETTGVAYGVKPVGDGTTIDFLSRFEITHENGYNYITIYCSNDQNDPEYNNIRYKGVIASQKNPKTKVITPMLGLINEYDGNQAFHQQFFGEHSWAYRSADIPDIDKVISEGDLVVSDGVIYTHATDAEVLATAGGVSATSDKGKAALAAGYSVYGQEISDNYTYGADNYASGGERCTTIAVKYPAYIPMDPTTGRSVSGSIISLNDTEYCRDYGETGSNMYAVELPGYEGWWCQKNSDGTYTKVTQDDSQAAGLYRVYGVGGKVSSFFRYYDNEADGAGTVRNGYPKVGVTLVVNYKSVVDGNNWSEFEFLYVQPNPAWAHTMAAMKNNNSDIGNNRNSSYGIFNRFEGSYGKATELSSTMIRYPASGTNTQSEEGWGYGVSGYLTDFSTHSFADEDLDTIDEIKTLFNFYQDESIGVNSGSFAARGHDDSGPNAYASVPQVIDTQYYVDYSDKNEYGKLITVSGSGVPTGYQFQMKTSNFLWANYSGASIMDVTCYQMNKTGMNITYTTQPATANAGPNVDEYPGSYTNAGNYNANFEYFGTDVTISGYKRWFDDSMLFHTDLRNNSNSYFNFPYRNKLLFYFSDGTQNYLKKDDVSYHLFGNGSDYVDGTSMNDTPSKVYNYYNYSGSKAYSVVPNGKASTNSWTGTATFTGKSRVTANTLESLNKNYGDGRYYDANAKRVYDGYYYYENANNNVKRECWTADESTAQNSTVSTWGKMDVTAENYANYILEMGNYHKVTDTGIKGGRFLGNETYHYYNIGVATCDKGAARDFMNNFALKRLVSTKDENGKRHVTLDANGRPTVDTNMDETDGEVIGDAEGNLYVQDVSAKSYRDYVDALARLEWFVKNPQNTLQNDLALEDEYSDITEITSAGADEYTTAYANGNAVYLTDITNRNVFNDGVTTTDAVQAKLIADVIEAYENLYTVEDYKKVEEEYKEIVEEVKQFNDGTIDTSNYTDNSVDNFKNAAEALERAVAYYTAFDEEGNAMSDPDSLINTTDDPYDEGYWRYSEYSGADYEKIREAMAELKASLMPKAVVSTLQSTADTKAETVEEGIFTEGTQTKRYDQWLALHNEVLNADSTKLEGSATDGVIQSNTGTARYQTQGETKYVDAIIGRTEAEQATTEYPYEVFRLDSAPQDATAGTDTTWVENGDVYVTLSDTIGGYAVLSDNQQTVNDENHTLAAMTVDSVDEADAYSAFDSAYNVILNSVNREKYTAEGKAILDTALSLRYTDVENVHRVYDKATAEDVAIYAAVMGSAPFVVNDDLKVTGYQQTDETTAALLSAANELEAKDDNDQYPYIRQFTVNYDVTGGSQTYPSQSKTVYYGDFVEFEIPEEARKNAIFSIQSYDDEGNALPATKATYNGDTLQRVAKSNMDITVKVTNKAETTGYKVQIKNIYNTVTEILYCDKANLPEAGTTATLNFGSDSVTPDDVPFYSFSKWEREVDDENSTAVYTPVYTAGDELTFDIQGIDNAKVTGASATADGATTYTTSFDTMVNIDASDVENFYAWATEIVVDGVTKYQIASYDPSYSFYAVNGNGTIANVTGERFVPVLRTGTDADHTYSVNSTELTAANVDAMYYIDTTAGVINNDSILKQKLDQKAPFISTIGAKMNASNNAATGYCRISYGSSSAPSEFGVLARSKATTQQQINDGVMNLGTAAMFKTSNIISETGQFVYTINKSSAYANNVLFRGYMYYDFVYDFNGTNTSGNETSAKLNVGETSGSIATAQRN